jgi:hypothetical protein
VAAQSRQGLWRDSVPGTTKRATFYKFSLWRIIFNKLDLKVLKIKQIPSPWCYYSFSPFLIDSLSPAASLLISQSPSQSPQSSLMVQKICEVVYAHGFGSLWRDSDIDDADGCLLSAGIQAISGTSRRTLPQELLC